MPLRFRLALLFALATAVVIGLAGATFVLQLRVSVDASLDPGLRARVASVADELGSEGGLPRAGLTDEILQSGDACRWTLNHTIPVGDPLELFERHLIQVG